MPDVFISYKAEDRPRIEPLVQALQADGFAVWWDQHIGTGDDWRQSIERQLDAAKSVVVVWSKRSVAPEGHFVRDEASRALQRRVYVPITIDDVRVPLGFGESQATSLRGWRGDASDPRYQSVLAAVRRVAGSNSGESVAASVPPRLGRRALITGGVVAAIVAGAGTWAWLKRGATDTANSIAVLPFANLSADPAQAYFADGIAGEIRNTLTRIAGLKVAGSTSSAAVRVDDAQTAAKKLGVSSILTGSVRQTPSTIRVTAELIDGESGLTRWSQNYDRAPGDAIRIQTEIAAAVVQALALALTASAKDALAAGETSNIAAQTLVFQARELSYELTVPALQQSMQLLERAIALDPNYARAYAMKSFVANNLATRTSATPAQLAAGRDEALGFAQTALSIAPDLPIARSALGFAYGLKLQVADSWREHEAAFALASGDPDVIRNYGYALSGIGKPQEGLRYVDEALTLDPLNWASHRAHVSVLFDARRYEEAVGYSQKLRRDAPDMFRFPLLLGHALLLLGRSQDAATEFGDNVTGAALLAARSGQREQALAKVAELKQRDREFAEFDAARIHAQLGDSGPALESLNSAWEARDWNLIKLKTDPYLDPVRRDPRFAALERKLGLPG